MKFDKPPCSPYKLIELLQKRGMSIDNHELATFHLKTIGYYRFTGYALHFEEFKDRKRTHQFKTGSNFNDVIALYEFDDKLRTLIFDYIGHIEIAFRAALCSEVAIETKNSHWYTDSKFFNNYNNKWRALIDDCKRESSSSKETFIASYKEKYTSPKLPPAWMMLEIMSMGVGAKLYADLKHKNLQKRVAYIFNIPPHHLTSWIHALSVLRNLCAHHYRIWNRNFTIRLTLTERQKKFIQSHTALHNPEDINRKLSVFLIVINDMLSSIRRDKPFKSKMKELLKEYPQIPLEQMGLNSELIQKLGYN